VRTGVVEHLLEVARAHGHAVVDTGFGLDDDVAGDVMGRPARNQLTLGSLAVADEVLAVGTPDPVGLARLARGLADLPERCPGAPIRVVVNRMRSGLGWSERDVAGVIGGFAQLAGVHFLPDDRATADRALATGVSLPDAGESDLAKGLRAVADAVVPPTAHHRRARRGVRTRRADRDRRR
jgi:hypothetical protein